MNAQKLPVVTSSLLAIALGAFLGSPAARAGNQLPQLLAQNQYPQDLRENYLRSCQQRAASEGLNRTQAQSLCQCTLRRFQARFTSAQFIALSRRASQTGQAPQAFTEIGRACYRQLRNSN
ncbi:MAG: hypothetical protein SVX43_02825 [Cyanobacteriota bacterium]|nr:hypothetical protein [Cyanobacteriota bacterium]